MINCSIHNYKEWIGAYIDGSLSNSDMRSAEIFLQQHPQILDSYLLELEEFSLVPEEIELAGKENLELSIVSTANIHSNNFIEYFISDCEGLLSKNEQEELNNFLQLNPKLKKESQIYGLTKLVVDSSIQYPSKNELLKKSRPTVPLFWPVSAAASILLIVGIWFLWPSSNINGMAFLQLKEFKTKSVEVNVPINSIDHNPQIVNNNTSKNNGVISKTKIQHSIVNNQRSSPVDELVAFNEMQTSLVPEKIYLQNESLPSLALVPVSEIGDKLVLVNENITDAKPKKKGLLSKILNDDQKYIEDYVNATFTAFSDNKEDEKWALKVERDENGKSKKVKFTSPLFSAKNRN